MLLVIGEDGIVQSTSDTPLSLFGFSSKGMVGVSIIDVVEDLAIGASVLGGIEPMLELLALRWG